MEKRNQSMEALAGVSDEVAFVACAGSAAGKRRFAEKRCSTCADAVESGFERGECRSGCVGVGSCASVCKQNAIRIEGGKITGAVTETMVNGNLGEIFSRIRDISSEVYCDGGSVIPWIAVDGIVISGK